MLTTATYLLAFDEPGELRVLATELTTGETYFFRQPEQLFLPARECRRGRIEDALQVEPLGDRARALVEHILAREHGLCSHERDTERLARLVSSIKQ